MSQDDRSKLNMCLDLIKNNNILVLATYGVDAPHTSLMAYISSDDGHEIYMLSSMNSRKWLNISQNSRVGIMIDDRDGKLANQRESIKALTITGSHIDVSEQEKELILKKFKNSNLEISNTFSGPQCGIIRIRPDSFQLLDGPSDSFYTESI
ncbi:pyridoxamine 5'-phosphate oxidase family protein [Maridesulfovibrio bastinii]|uniref:pyridoxamine 5'-phosphate oxidase family protein n=1 Tax=Maridesulfovibrio bastinii TaxID=47157 RepID=UPI000415E31C|nr:pyridoxamine 5'-phosphate oxidase family protein [Maridesulfovibrio bastinii]